MSTLVRPEHALGSPLAHPQEPYFCRLFWLQRACGARLNGAEFGVARRRTPSAWRAVGVVFGGSARSTDSLKNTMVPAKTGGQEWDSDKKASQTGASGLGCGAGVE